MSKIKIGENRSGAELYAEVDADGLWIEIDKPGVSDIYICVNKRSDLEALAELAAEALRAYGATAARILPAVLRLGSHLSDAQGYEIAWAIARSTRQHGLRPELVVALISVESGYRLGVISPTNDHGLMQLHGDRVYDIERNIALVCLKLATWRATYQCGEREMLAHYNGGCRPPGVSWGYADRVLGLAEEVTQ